MLGTRRKYLHSCTSTDQWRVAQGRSSERDSGGSGRAAEAAPALDLSAIGAKTTEIVVEQTINIPHIAVVAMGEVTTGFRPFKLDVSQLHLHTNEQDTLAAEIGLKEQRPEDYIVQALVGFDDIDYFTHADLLYEHVGQMVQHLRGYLSEDEAISVVDRNRRLIAREIYA